MNRKLIALAAVLSMFVSSAESRNSAARSLLGVDEPLDEAGKKRLVATLKASEEYKQLKSKYKTAAEAVTNANTERIGDVKISGEKRQLKRHSKMQKQKGKKPKSICTCSE